MAEKKIHCSQYQSQRPGEAGICTYTGIECSGIVKKCPNELLNSNSITLEEAVRRRNVLYNFCMWLFYFGRQN